MFSGSFVHMAPGRSLLPPPRWRRSRDSRIGQLQRLQGIDQAGADIVVALSRPEALCARGQDAANVGGRQFRIAFQQQPETLKMGSSARGAERGEIATLHDKTLSARLSPISQDGFPLRPLANARVSKCGGVRA